MSKLALNPAPTFQATVLIPIAGAEPVPVKMTFKHRTKKQLAEHIEQINGSADQHSDAQVILDTVTAWDLDDPLNAENVERLCESYHGAGLAIFNTYYTTLIQGRQGN